MLNDCGNVKLWHVPIFIHVFGVKCLRALNLSGFVCYLCPIVNCMI